MKNTPFIRIPEIEAMNKPAVTLRHLHPFDEARPITRDRAAYLLRAARSRRPGNILQTVRHLYRLLDCAAVVEIAR